ncbi:hypothetical protein BZA77DRAFT_323317 [Pyronema omphalodes]|nr:hypothetical protein BZA77DRAFT_323317 [Pyronema omphalodes]
MVTAPDNNSSGWRFLNSLPRRAQNMIGLGNSEDDRETRQKREPHSRKGFRTTERNVEIPSSQPTHQPQEITARPERSYAQAAGGAGLQQGNVRSIANQYNRNNESSIANNYKRVEEAPPPLPEDVIAPRQQFNGQYHSKRPSRGSDGHRQHDDGSKQTSHKRTSDDFAEEKFMHEIAKLKSTIEKKEKDLAYWQNTYTELRAEYDSIKQAYEGSVKNVKNLEEDKETLKQSRNKHKEKAERLERALEEEKSTSAERLQTYQNALEAEKARFSKLTTEHIKSINSVGTGLEPITDEYFIKAFRTLQDQVGGWCRKTFKGKEMRPLHELPDSLREALSQRVRENAGLKFAQFAETALWYFIEHKFFLWFPGFPLEMQPQLQHINNLIRRGDLSEDKTRTEFWRAYTASMIFQMPDTPATLDDCNEEINFILPALMQMATAFFSWDDNLIPAFVDIIRTATLLAAQLRCQRSVYEIDYYLDSPYDETTMTSVDFDLDDEETEKRQAVITAVIARGIVKRPYAGSREIHAVISKPRVKIAFTTD